MNSIRKVIALTVLALSCLMAVSTLSAQAKKEISFIVATAYKDYFENVLIKSFNAKYPDIDVKAIYNAEPDVIIKQQLAAGGGPDIITTQGTTTLLDFAKAGRLVALDGYAAKYGWMNKFSAWAFKPVSDKGKLYGLPGKVDSEMVYYNKDMFSKNGWNIPTSYEDLVALCDKIQAKGIIPFAFGAGNYKYANEWWWSLAFTSRLGKDKLEKLLKGEVPWTGKEPTDAMQKMLDLYQKGYINSRSSTSLTIDAATQLFATGKAAMKMEGTWLLGNLTSEQKPEFDWGVFAMPSWSADVPQVLPFALGIGVAINAKSKNADEAAKFLDVWSDRDNQIIGITYKAMGFPPVDGIDLSKVPGLDSHVNEIQAVMNSFTAKKATSYLSWTYWGPQTRVYTCENIDGLWLKQLDLPTFMRGMQKASEQDKAEGKLFNFD
jgi:raffinose/stachyose/melibiose transport system substrate-binding protein